MKRTQIGLIGAFALGVLACASFGARPLQANPVAFDLPPSLPPHLAFDLPPSLPPHLAFDLPPSLPPHFA